MRLVLRYCITYIVLVVQRRPLIFGNEDTVAAAGIMATIKAFDYYFVHRFHFLALLIA
jgi:hypothetical protein